MLLIITTTNAICDLFSLYGFLLSIYYDIFVFIRIFVTINIIIMKVYKFGGASVQSADGVKNLAKIINNEPGCLVLIISAMGKTTNALEKVINTYINLNITEATEFLNESKNYHFEIINQLFDEEKSNLLKFEIDELCDGVSVFMSTNRCFEYDYCYDQIVSLGELLSTHIVSNYLNHVGISNIWLDARQLLRSDNTFREANIHFDRSEANLNKAIDFSHSSVFLTQGFIAGNKAGNTTTLGREGSDYSAAVIGSLINAESVTIWKDVPGVLNADPRIFENTKLLSAISYKEAAELSYYGAQIIHPKTIKPLQNKNISLYVKSFIDIGSKGTIIGGNKVIELEIPVYIIKNNQVLISILSKDFSFALEETLTEVFNVLLRHRLKVNLIQSSAVSISVCVDNTRYVMPAIEEFLNDYDVRYNENLQLLTIRNYTDEMIAEYSKGKQVFIEQKSRRTVRILMDADNNNK